MKVPRLPIVASVRCLTAFFVVAGIAALVVGLHDVVLPGGRIGVLFTGLMLVLSGAAFIGAAWQLIPIGLPQTWSEGKQPPCKQPVPVAYLVSILLGGFVFFGALAGTGTQRAIVIGVSLLFIVVGSVGFALFWNEIEVSIVRVGAGVALTIAGLLVGVWEFWYQNHYVPSHLDRAVGVQVGLKKLGVQGRYDVLSATFGYQDVGDRTIVVLGSDYTLTGSAVVRCPRPATPKGEAEIFGGALPDPQRRFMSGVWEVRPATVLAAGRFIADGKRLGPNVPASRQMILYVPHDRYQLLRLRAQAFAISDSVPLADQLPVRRYLGDHDLYDLWKLGRSGWFQDLVSGRRGWIVTRYELVQSPGKTTSSPDLRLTAHYPGLTWSGGAPSNAEIKSLFHEQLPVKTNESFADAELPLTSVVAPTAARLEPMQLTTLPKACRPVRAATTQKTPRHP